MIGVFDSGIGGLSVLQEIHRQCPDQSTLYFADQANIPYGQKSKSELISYCETITQYLLGRGASVIVVACNTATAAAIDQLRKNHPDIPFIGMEPALKPAASTTKSGKVGVLATAGTFKSQKYAQLMTRFSDQVEIFENSCVGLVEQIESGHLESQLTREMLEEFINPMLEKKVDTLILGCTHYPFVKSAIKSIVEDKAQVINPAPAVAKQVGRIVNSLKSQINADSSINLNEYITSGSLEHFVSLVNRLKNVRDKSIEEEENSINNRPYTLYQTFYQKNHNN
ncbi:MAG: glutamate racemase [Chloroflexota bacterium]